MENVTLAKELRELGPLVKTIDMETKVWRNLPHELLLPILAHLPWWSNLKLQSVCKSWNSLLHNSNLLYKFSPPPLPLFPCFIVQTSCGGVIFNLALKKWHPIPQSWLLPNCPSSNYQVVAVAGGVFLLEGKDEELGRILINPLNKSHKQIPPLPVPEQGHRSTCTILGMVIDKETHMHRIIAEQTEYEEAESTGVVALEDPLGVMKFCEIYVYDTNKSSPSWELATTLQSEIDLCLEIESAVLIGDDLYILMVQPLGWCWMYRVFKALETSWKEVPTDIAFDLGHVHLFEHQGSLMLVGGTDVMKCDKMLSVEIWRLDMVKAKWESVLSMPQELIKKLYVLPENGIFYHFDVEKDYACFVNPFTEITITCDIVKKVWWSIERHEYGANFHFVDDLVFLFNPNLDIVL